MIFETSGVNMSAVIERIQEATKDREYDGRLWYEQALVETVIGVRALTNRREWANRDIEKALSPEALTAAAVQRYHVAGAAKEDLQRKLPRTAAQTARERPRQLPEVCLVAG